MRRNVLLAAMVILAAAVFGGAATAEEWNGLTINAALPYSLNIAESYNSWGYIQQFVPPSSTSIAVGGGVAYSLPSISVTGAASNPFWGVCIDTHEWSTSPEGAYLRKGWWGGSDPPGTDGRLNGTVLDENAWNHTTYLFSQYQSAGIDLMVDIDHRAAFQLAIWEVMSGDGDAATGGNWGSGNFTATGASGDQLAWANDYVKQAYTGFTDKYGAGSLYFSGVKTGTGTTCYQDYLVFADTNHGGSGGGPPSVPEIPAAALAPLGLAALGLLKRRSLA